MIGLSLGNNCDVSFRQYRLSPLYTNLKPVEIPTKELNVGSVEECVTACYNDVMCTGFLFSGDHGVCSVYRKIFHTMTFVNKMGTQAYERLNSFPSDCYDVMKNGYATSSVYTVQPTDNGSAIDVYCELSLDDGWLVIQRRTDGSEEFYRTWNEYKDGFGNLTNEFWLGNSQIHRITSQGLYDLRIDLEGFEGNNRFALYKNFSVASEQDFFRLSLGEYSGNAGDGLGHHRGALFSAKDKDLDSNSYVCAQRSKGSWWYTQICHKSNLNGQYLRGTHSSFGDGVNWKSWLGNYYSLKRTVMKIRPMQF
ncbi:fibrinogen C domain-containing protein 1-like [Gigantopelta aegis]|uniref:fibrinogen C domain-containing protein 1-like n=1 Tax=Gigantopelta aegis TaxID=1735272 RepID=UPI001B88A1EA|nr:fibrinogen C domain-containing protein 1-like [Gigantopelta aegis]